MTHCVAKPLSRGQGLALSNRYQVKRFKNSESMAAFLASGSNSLEWRPISENLKSGVYLQQLDRNGIRWIDARTLSF